jgi:hypothetical protein
MFDSFVRRNYGMRTVARPSGCRIETRLDARRSGAKQISHKHGEYRTSHWKSVETSLDAADTSVRAT